MPHGDRDDIRRRPPRDQLSSPSPLLRPDVAALAFTLLDRDLHPELVVPLHTVERGGAGFAVRFDVTAAGHRLRWQGAGLTLTEILTEADDPLPTHGHLFGHRVGRERHERLALPGGVRYAVAFSAEALPPEEFAREGDHLADRAARSGVFVRLNPGNRVGPGALAFAELQTRPGSFLCHAFHTFPHEGTVVKVQTLIDFPTG